MLIYPRAEHRPLGPQTEPQMTGHDVVCLHTMVGYLSSTESAHRDPCHSTRRTHVRRARPQRPDGHRGR